MVSVLASSEVDRRFDHVMGQANDYKTVCFCAVALSSKLKDWLLRNKDIACDWSDMSTCGILFE
jgi:hypothetical protein